MRDRGIVTGPLHLRQSSAAHDDARERGRSIQLPPKHMSLCRCSRCESHFYKEDNSSASCRFHTGHFRTWWSCCKEPLIGATGCRVGAHVEDVGYTAMLDSLSCAPAAPEPAPTFIIEMPNGAISVAEVPRSPASLVALEKKNFMRAPHPTPSSLLRGCR